MPATLRVFRPAKKFLRIGTGVKHVAGSTTCRCGKCKPKTPPEAPHVAKSNAHEEMIGKAVFFASEGERVAGKAIRADGDSLVVRLAVPSRDGVLLLTDTELTVKATDLEVTAALMQQKRMAAFEAGANIELPGDQKFVTLRGSKVSEDSKDGPVTDYLDVIIEGYASTFVETTKRDRGGDYILPGAFNATLPEFKKNPVILIDHRNAVDHLAGSWANVSVNQRGLAVQGKISNAPGLRDTRFKLVEGHLKGLSIGGIWYYADDNFGIEEATLFEISLTPVPMNPDALAYTRSLGVADCRKAFSQFWRSKKSLRTEPPPLGAKGETQ